MAGCLRQERPAHSWMQSWGMYWELTCAHCGLLSFCFLPKVLGEPEPHQSSPRLVYSESMCIVGLGHTLSLHGYAQNGISF